MKCVIAVISNLHWDSNYVKCCVKQQAKLMNSQRHVYFNDNELHLLITAQR